MTKNAKGNTKFLPKGLEIIHEDRDILVVNKPSGLLTIATESEKAKTAYASLTDYVKKGNFKSKNRIFIVAGSIAMGLGGYLAGRTEVEHYQSELKREYDEVERVPEKEKEEVTRDGKKVKPEITKTLTVNDTIVQNAIGLIGNPIIENAIKNNTSVKIQVFSNSGCKKERW